MANVRKPKNVDRNNGAWHVVGRVVVPGVTVDAKP